MKKPSKKHGPAAKRRAAGRKQLQEQRGNIALILVLTKLSIARKAFGGIMSEVCPPGANHLSDTLDGVVRVLTHYAEEKYPGPE